ncbi:MAG: glycosyltransferase family 4 protein, partial [Archangium sp.]
MSTGTAGGVWTYALELGRALSRRGVEVTLAAMGAPLTGAQWAEVRREPGLCVEQSTWRLEGAEEAWEDVEAAGEWLLELESRLRPDAVHLNGYCHGALPWRRKPLVVAHACALSWWEAVKGEPALEQDVRYRWEVTRGLRAAGRVVAPTAALLESLVHHYGPLPPVEVIPHARRYEDFPPGPVREPFILTTGRLWDEANNLEVLETVAPRLDWPVLVAGDCQHPDGGEVRARYVRTLGRLPVRELAAYMGRASIYVLPARYEPFGLPALEAALAGCALVLGDIPSLREVWEGAAVFV